VNRPGYALLAALIAQARTPAPPPVVFTLITPPPDPWAGDQAGLVEILAAPPLHDLREIPGQRCYAGRPGQPPALQWHPCPLDGTVINPNGRICRRGHGDAARAELTQLEEREP